MTQEDSDPNSDEVSLLRLDLAGIITENKAPLPNIH